MSRRRARIPEADRYPEAWTVHYDYTPPGRATLTAGTEFRVRGERGRFRFWRAVTTTTGDAWVDAFDPRGSTRSICPQRITRVHRDLRTRKGVKG